jgi:hypothetical protein
MAKGILADAMKSACPDVDQVGSVALSLRTTVHPLHTRFGTYM